MTFLRNNRNESQCQSPRFAFTLVELLVVIAIISILAGLLLPALQDAIESARKIDCASRMRQTGIMCAMYESDSTGILMPWYTPNDAGTWWPYGLTSWQLLAHAGYLGQQHVGYFYNAGSDAPEFDADWMSSQRSSSPLLCPSGFYNGSNSRNLPSAGGRFSDGPSGTWAGSEEEMYTRDSGRGWQPALFDGTLIYADWVYQNWPAGTGYLYPSIVSSYGYNQHLASRWDGTKYCEQGEALAEIPTKALNHAKYPPSKQLRFIEGVSQHSSGAYGVGQGMMKVFRTMWNPASGYLFWAFRVPHMGMTNFINLDGHAGSISLNEYDSVYQQDYDTQQEILDPYFQF